MKHARYIGPFEPLHGLEALIQETHDENVVKAQFDSWSAVCEDVAYYLDWHMFPAKDFEVDNG